MIVKQDWLLINVISGDAYIIKNSKPNGNSDGLLRIFHQYALETYGAQYALIIPTNSYRVSRTKWLFRPAVYKVEVL